MAWVQARNGSWRVLFRYDGKQHTFWVGEVSEKEAAAVADKVDYWLMRLKQELVKLPAGCDVVTFVQHDGRPPEQAAESRDLTLAGLRDAFLAAHEGKLEETTLAGVRLHFKHLVRVFGPERNVSGVEQADLQRYVDRRAREWIDPNVYRARRRARDAAKKPRKNRKPPPPESGDRPRRHPSPSTVKKEVISLRTAWNWARAHLKLGPEFPGRKLAYAKTDEKLPFMTWEEAERRVLLGDDADTVWECVYLKPAEAAELLAWVKGRDIDPWIYPMFCVAAYTGARRSEIVRALPSDLDLAASVVTIRERKKDKNRRTTRRVPLTPTLRDVLAGWVAARAHGKMLFCKSDGRAVDLREAHSYFLRAVKGSKWAVLRGWHVFRHSFISALASKGVDQRVIDDMVGHSTDEQRARYRHLHPDVTQQAVLSAFG